MTETSEKSWTFYWLTGQREVLPGATAADALNRAGYSAGALSALDFFAEGDRDDDWTWNPDTRHWGKANARAERATNEQQESAG